MTPERAIEIINYYLRIQDVKEKVTLAMDLKTALPLCDTAGHYGSVLLHNSNFDEGRELTEARRTLDKYFYDKDRLEKARLQAAPAAPYSAPAHVVSSIPVPIEKDLKIINSYLKEQKIKHVVVTTMDPQIALELCGKIAESYDKLLKAKKLDKARELLDARARVESYFSERLAKLRGPVVAAAAAPSASAPPLYRTRMTEQSLAATGRPAAPIYDGAHDDDEEMVVSDSPPLPTPYQVAPTPMVFMGPGSAAPAVSVPGSPPSYEAAEAMRCISLAEQLGFDEMELLAAMAVINSVPGIRAKLSLDIDSNAGIMIVSDASRYAGNFHISVPKERRKEILSANKLLRSYFDKLGYDDSSSASQVIPPLAQQHLTLAIQGGISQEVLFNAMQVVNKMPNVQAKEIQLGLESDRLTLSLAYGSAVRYLGGLPKGSAEWPVIRPFVDVIKAYMDVLDAATKSASAKLAVAF